MLKRVALLLTSLSIGISASAHADSFPYGYGTFPFLLRQSDGAGYVASISRDGAEHLSDFGTRQFFYNITLQSALPKQARWSGTIVVEVRSQELSPSKGDLVFYRKRENMGESQRSRIGRAFDAEVVAGTKGIIPAAEVKTFEAAQKFLARPDLTWAQAYYDVATPADPKNFSLEGRSAKYWLERFDYKTTSEIDVQEWIEKALRWETITANESILAAIGRAHPKLLAKSLASLIDDAPVFDVRQDLQTWTSALFLYASVDETQAPQRLEIWAKQGKREWSQQQKAILDEVRQSLMRRWTAAVEGKIREGLASGDLTVRLATLDTLGRLDFYRAGPPYALVEERLKLPGETIAFKKRAIDVLGHSLDGLLVINSVVLDPNQPLALRLYAVDSFAKYPNAFRGTDREKSSAHLTRRLLEKSLEKSLPSEVRSAIEEALKTR